MHHRVCRRSTFVALALLAAAALLPAAAFAGDQPAEKPGAVADLWVMWPKDGHEAQFLEAAKSHLAWRKQAGEKFAYWAFQPVVGDDLEHFVWRSGEHHWADLDANREWAMKNGAIERFERDVMPHVERISHYLSEDDLDNSHWTESEDYRLFQVESYVLRPGAYNEMVEALKKVKKAAVDGKWSRSWAVSWNIGGDGAMDVVFPYRSYAEMQTPDPSFMKVLAQSLGSEEAAMATMKQLSGSFERSTTSIYMVRPDLSTPR
jgi:hypothetical protein